MSLSLYQGTPGKQITVSSEFLGFIVDFDLLCLYCRFACLQHDLLDRLMDRLGALWFETLLYKLFVNFVASFFK